MLVTLLVVAQLQVPTLNGIQLNTDTATVQSTLNVDVLQCTSDPQKTATVQLVQPTAGTEILQSTYNPQQ